MEKRYDTVKEKAIIMGIGIVIGAVVTFVLMLIFALVISTLCIDRAFAQPFATVCLAFGSFAAAFFSAKKIGEKGYLIGTVIGILTFVIVLVISLLVGSGEFTNNTLFHFIITLLASAIGGILGVHKNTKKII